MTNQNSDITRRPDDTRVSVSSRGIEIKRQGRPVGGEVGGSGWVYLAIDCSASMAGDKLTQAKRGAIDFFPEARQKGYAVGLVSFETAATHICEPQRDLAVIRLYVDKLERGISTDMAGGIQLATDKLQGRSGARAIVVVTDGIPDSEKDALAAAREAKNGGIDIITIGTDDADHDFLKRLATRNDLSVMVPSNDLGQGIASTAKMLPGTGGIQVLPQP